MRSESNIVLMTNEQATAELVGSALDSREHLVLADTYREITGLRAHLARTPTDAVIVDIDSYQNGVLRELSLIMAMHPDTRVVVISSKFNEQLVLEAMQAGARHFLRKHSITAELDGVLERLLFEAKREVKLGDIITVFSTSGGCGATTVAVNLANELRLATSESVLAIDLDTCYGTVSDYLGVEGHYGIADVLSRRKPIDKDLIESSACSYRNDFHVLLSPASINNQRAESLQLDNLGETLEICRQGYRYTVVDAPRLAPNVAIDLAKASKFILIVFQLTVRDLKSARSLVAFLKQNEISSKKLIPLANRVKKRGPLVRMEDSKKVVGLDSFACIRNDWRKVMKSVNLALPLAQTAKRSSLRKDFQKLAARIHNNETNSRNTEAG
ncbi:MAG: AAA family ATPase [Sedimentisphaerales bacterium]|nr:AAA family ATPase [Sedimentisphaerales bacterium]